MASYIGRRKFLATLGGAAAWPLVARAQQPAMAIVGLVNIRSADASARNAAAFREAAFATLVRDRADALFVAGDGFFNSRRVQFATLAARDRRRAQEHTAANY